MSDNINHFKVLQIPENSSSEDIKKAYLNLAKQYHPDTNKESYATERFRLISASYEILKDESKRAAYLIDRRGDADYDAWNAKTKKYHSQRRL